MNLTNLLLLLVSIGCLIYIYYNLPSTRFRKIFGCSPKEEPITLIPKVKKILEEKFRHFQKKWSDWEKFIESGPSEFEINDNYVYYGNRGEDFRNLTEAVYLATYFGCTGDRDSPLSINIPNLFSSWNV